LSKASNGKAASAPEPTYWIDHKTAEVVFKDRDGRERRLRPSMEATLEVERALGVGVDALRTRAAITGLPGIDNRLSLTTDELAAIACAGLRAAGAIGMTPDEAGRMIWALGRAAARQPIFEFVWACADGGRLRADDLKNEVSPNGSAPEPSGGDDLTEALVTAAQASAGSSA
jgi:hypothetical protein